MNSSLDLTAFAQAVQEQDLAVQVLRVWKDGALVGGWESEPERKFNQFSIMKSVTSTAVGFALSEGLFTLEDPVLEWFREEAPASPSENLRRMKLRHLLTMTLGFEHQLLQGETRKALGNRDWISFVLGQEVVQTPGTVFRYNNAGPYLLGVLIQRQSGMTLEEYLTPRLFAPLGLETPELEKDPRGYSYGSSSLWMTTTEVGKLGRLYLQKGVWEGKRILPEGWVEEATAPHVSTGRGDDEVGRHYGYFWWGMPDGMYRAYGKWGQYLLVAPKKNAVLAVNATQKRGEQQVLRTALRTVLPLL